MRKPLWAVALLTAGTALWGGSQPAPQTNAVQDPVASAVKAYSGMNYRSARKIAAQAPDLPQCQLISGLCDLYERENQNISRGQMTLANLFYDEKAPLNCRLEAGVALGRSAQLMKDRDEVYRGAANQYDHAKIYKTVLKLSAYSVPGRDAAFYFFTEQLNKPEQRKQAFEWLESYLAGFKGDPKLLTPLHLLAEYEYVRQFGDYENAVRHLKAGYKIGFSNPSEDRSALFRLGFLYYKRLKDKKMAIEYFNEYLRVYPFSGQAVVAERYLRELGAPVKNEVAK